MSKNNLTKEDVANQLNGNMRLRYRDNDVPDDIQGILDDAGSSRLLVIWCEHDGEYNIEGAWTENTYYEPVFYIDHDNDLMIRSDGDFIEDGEVTFSCTETEGYSDGVMVLDANWLSFASFDVLSEENEDENAPSDMNVVHRGIVVSVDEIKAHFKKLRYPSGHGDDILALIGEIYPIIDELIEEREKVLGYEDFLLRKLADRLKMIAKELGFPDPEEAKASEESDDEDIF